MFMKKMLLFLGILLTFNISLCAQLPYSIDSIPMRDGKKLACDIFLPDTSGGKTYPVILVQTPYNRVYYRIKLPFGITNISASNYAFVIADWRGFYGSAAAITSAPDRGKDGYDIVEWIASKIWSNEKIGTWGPSALGRIQFLTAKENPPHLTCIAPLVAASQYEYEEYYPGGVYRTEYVQQLDALGFGLGPIISTHKVKDYFWNYSDTSTMYSEKIKVPTLMIGGWYDHGTNQIMELFDSLRLYSPINVRAKHHLLMGPWAHGGFGQAQVGTGQQGELFYPEAAGWSDSIALNFFNFYLRNISNNWESTPVIQYFQMGENNWMSSPIWPPADVSPYKLYLNDNMLTSQVPINTSSSSQLIYNSKNPSPTIGGATLRPDLLQGPYDQAPIVENRNDILIFSSAVLGADVVMKGKSTIHLYVSSDRKDTDFSIRLTDVYPNGKSMLLADGIKRMRFRNGYKASDTSGIQPGQIYHITIDLPDICNTFLAGHRIRCDITSSNYPRYDCNLNNGGPMYTAGDSLIATNTVYTNSTYASYIELPLKDFAGNLMQIAQNNNTIGVFPNPTNDNIYITGIAGAAAIVLSDIKGIVVYSEKKYYSEKNITQINLQTLEPGFYILSVQFEGTTSVNTKVLVSR